MLRKKKGGLENARPAIFLVFLIEELNLATEIKPIHNFKKKQVCVPTLQMN